MRGFPARLKTANDSECRTRFDLLDGWQQELREHLEACYDGCDPVYAVKSLVRSWISWAGPSAGRTADGKRLPRSPFLPVLLRR